MAALVLHILSHLGLQALYSQVFSGDVFILNVPFLTVLYIISNIVLFFSSWCVFHFGCGTVSEKIHCYLKQLGFHRDMQGDCVAYLPHALALVSILVYVACNGPIMYDYVTAYAYTKDKILIAHLTSCVIYMLLWVVLWFCFTVKQNWNFEIDEISLKRYVILQNRQRFSIECEAGATNSEPECVPALPEERGSHDSNVEAEETFSTKLSSEDIRLSNEDNISDSTTSTINAGCTPRSANGILTHKVYSKTKRIASEQKVKFQEATKIVIETNLDSDLDTIPESDTECADSAMFSGSGGSNDSTESPPIGAKKRPNSKDLILNPKSIKLNSKLHKKRQRMWSSAEDLEHSRGSKSLAQDPARDRPLSALSEQYTSSHTAPYSPRNIFVTNGHAHLFDNPEMSSAV